MLKMSGNKHRVINCHIQKPACKTSAQQKPCPSSEEQSREQGCCMNFPARSLAARLIPDTPRADLYTHHTKLSGRLSSPSPLLTSSPSRAACWTWWSCFLTKGKSLHLPWSPSLPGSSLPLSPSGWQDSLGRACNQFAGSSRSHRKDAEAQSEGTPIQAAGDRGPGSGQDQHHQTLCPPELLPSLSGHHRGGFCLEGAELGCWDCGTAAAVGYCRWVQRRTLCPITYPETMQNIDPN